MTYDHNQKAGNQGDIVKHIALIAALDTILAEVKDHEFRYADTFAGYAYSPLIKGHEWTQGVEKLVGEGERLSQNPHTKLWYEWYLRGRPQMLGGIYPGSSLIASDVCKLHEKQASLALWDVSPEVIANLMQTFQQTSHRITCRPAKAKSTAVIRSNFLLIDPPGLWSTANRSNPTWDALRRFLTHSDQNRSVFIWLPVKAVTLRKVDGKKVILSPPEEDEASISTRADAETLGCRTLRVRWASGGHTIGCLLIFKTEERVWNSVEAAVRHAVHVAGWQSNLSEGLLAIS